MALLNPFARFVLRLTDDDVGGRLLQWKGALAQVLLAEGTTIFVLAAGPGESERVEAFASQVAGGKGSVRIAVIGGDADLVALIDRVGVVGKVALLCFDRRGKLRAGPAGLVGKALGAAAEALAGEERDGASAEELEGLIRGRIESASKELEEADRYQRSLGRRRPVFTVGLLGVLVLIYMLDGAIRLPKGPGVLTAVGALRSIHDPAFAWPQLLGYSFLHGGLVHIGMNGYALYLLGSFLERLVGTARLIVTYTVACLVGGLAVAFLQGSGITVGASGGIWGLMTAMAVLFFRPQGIVPEVMVAPMRRSFGQILVLNLGLSFLPGISLWGHMGGGLGGAVLMASGALAWGLPRAEEAADPNRIDNLGSRFWLGAAIVCVLGLVASLAGMALLALGLEIQGA